MRLGIDTKIIPGETQKRLNIKNDLKWLDMKSQQGKDLERFRWFSNNYLSIDKNNQNIVHDIRFSSLLQIKYRVYGV